MDVYHKILIKLFEVTGGRDSQTVDFKDLVKNAGFLGNYNDILEFLSSQGWIAETTKQNFVRITHWGVKEAKNSHTAAPDALQAVKKEANQTISEVKELLIVLQEFASDASKEKFVQVEKKIAVLNSSVERLKSGLN